MSRYVICFLLLCIISLNTYTQQLNNVRDKMISQYKVWDFIGCIESATKLLPTTRNLAETYYYRAMSKLLLGDIIGSETDMQVAIENGYRVKNRATQFWMNSDKRRDYMIKYSYKKEKVFPELKYRPRYTRKDSLRGSLRPERTCFDVTFYNLHVSIDPSSKKINGSNEVTFKVVSATNCIQLDLFPEMNISSIVWKNQLLTFKREFGAVFINFPSELNVPDIQTVRVNYSGKPLIAKNPPWEGGFVWKKDKKHNFWCGVACEQLGASCWWPNKDHPSDEPDSMLLSFSVPNGYDVVSNGRPRGNAVINKGFTTYTWFVSNPINNYDVTFYLGKFAHFSDTMTNRLGKYPLDYYVLPFNLDKAKSTFNQTNNILKFYESAFGEYPFMNDKFSLVEAPFAGMEHQSAIAYGNGYDNSKKTHEYPGLTDDYIIIHETAHEWWGNSVTASDMADIWIQEGFATYSELLFLENKYGKEEYLTQTAYKLSQIFNIWPIVQNYNVNENAFASNDCYNKGAATLHNLRCCINNDSLFFSIIKSFALKYEKKIVTTRNFIDLVNEITSDDYNAFFKKYLYQTEPPILVYSYRNENGNIYVKYRWEGVDKSFKMPFCLIAGEQSFRIEGTTSTKSIVLKNAKAFRFNNPLLGTRNIKPNSFTYYWTRCDNENL